MSADVEMKELHDQLRTVARDVIAKVCPIERVRELLDDPVGHDSRLWSQAADLGWLGLEIPEDHGGAGMSFAELAVVLSELGRGLVPLPVVSSIVVGAAAIAAGGSADLKAEWLPALAAGQRRIGVALLGRGGDVGPGVTGVSFSGGVLDGVADIVLDAVGADAYVVAASSPDGPVTVLAEGRAEPGKLLDQTRRVGTVTFSATPATVLAGGEDLYWWLVDRAAVAMALDCAGGARRAMEVSVQYVGDREQFGRPVGSFQAIKHRCADMLVHVESSRVAAETAGRRLAPAPGARSKWTHIAKSHAAPAYLAVADSMVRVHGGIGFTWEHDAHLHVKRAQAAAALFGTTAWHREQLALTYLS